MAGPLGVVLPQVGLCTHRLHCRDLPVPHRGDVEKDEAARDSGAARELPGANGRVVRHAVVGVERIERRVRQHEARCQLAQEVGQLLDRRSVHHQGIVPEVEAAEARAQRVGGRLGLAVADLLDALLGLPLLLPELARLATLPVGKGDHVDVCARLCSERNGAGGTPDEVGRVGADDDHGLAHARYPYGSSCTWVDARPVQQSCVAPAASSTSRENRRAASRR